MNDHTWIFVSHSSGDLANVRKVRNYLENKGASPLLFHLLALKNPEEFWPLIEREIEERSFFLFCDSPSAQRSEWVKREREAVETASQKRLKRIWRMQVDGDTIDFASLDSFLSQTQVLLGYAKADLPLIAPYRDALSAAGFTINEPEFGGNKLFGALLKMMVYSGLYVPFVSRSSLSQYASMAEGETSFFKVAMDAASAPEKRALVAPVLLDDTIPPATLDGVQLIDANSAADLAPERLVSRLLGM